MQHNSSLYKQKREGNTEKGIDGFNIRMSAVVMNRIRVVSIFSLIIWFFQILWIFLLIMRSYFLRERIKLVISILSPKKIALYLV